MREIQSPLEAVQWQTALGREHFVQRLKDHLQRKGPAQHRELPAVRQLRHRPDAGLILDVVTRAYGCFKKQLLEKGARGNEARAVAMVLVWDCCGVSLREMGELFGGAGYTAVAQMIRRTREKNHQGALKFKLTKLMQELE